MFQLPPFPQTPEWAALRAYLLSPFLCHSPPFLSPPCTSLLLFLWKNFFEFLLHSASHFLYFTLLSQLFLLITAATGGINPLVFPVLLWEALIAVFVVLWVGRGLLAGHGTLYSPSGLILRGFLMRCYQPSHLLRASSLCLINSDMWWDISVQILEVYV